MRAAMLSNCRRQERSVPWARRQRERALETKVALGRLVWTDGLPVVGAVVAVSEGDGSVVSGDDGFFRIEVPAAFDRATTELTVQPGCWVAPEPFPSAVPLWPRIATDVRAEEYEIEAQSDLQLRIHVDPNAFAIIDKAGYESIRGVVFVHDDQVSSVRNEISEFLAKKSVLGRLDLPLAGQPFEQTLRVPLQPFVQCFAEAAPPEIYSKMGCITTPTVGVPLDRMSVAQVDLRLESNALIAGRVLDQDGKPLAACTVALPVLQRGRLGPRRILSNDEGWFVASGTPGDTHVVWASYQGVDSQRTNVSVGQIDIVLRCSTAQLRRVVVKHGTIPLERFALTANSSLFGKYVWPWLPARRDGVAWLPPKTEAEPMYLCWRERETYHEVPVLIPGAAEAPGFEIDVAQLSPEPRGVLYVENEPGGHTVRLTLVSPEPPPGFRRQGAAALPWRDAPLLGIPAGTYEVRLGTNPLEPPLATARVDLIAGENRLRVADVFRRR